MKILVLVLLLSTTALCSNSKKSLLAGFVNNAFNRKESADCITESLSCKSKKLAICLKYGGGNACYKKWGCTKTSRARRNYYSEELIRNKAISFKIKSENGYNCRRSYSLGATIIRTFKNGSFIKFNGRDIKYDRTGRRWFKTTNNCWVSASKVYLTPHKRGLVHSNPRSDPIPRGHYTPPTYSNRIVSRLPKIGTGYYSYSSKWKSYGRPQTISRIQEAGKRLNRMGINFAIGDISKRGGGYLSGHKSHKYGIDADFRLVNTQGKSTRCTISQRCYSRKNTQKLLETFIETGNINKIFFNDKILINRINRKYGRKILQSWPNHHNHIHIRWNN